MADNFLSLLFLAALICVVAGTRLRLGILALRRKQDLGPKPTPEYRPPPLVSYHIPWVGNILHFMLDKASFLEKCSHEYGPTFKLLIGGQNFVVTSSPEGIKNVYLGASKQGWASINEEHLMRTTGLTMDDDVFLGIFKQGLRIVARHFAPRNSMALLPPFNEQLLSELSSLAGEEKIISLSSTIHRILQNSLSVALWGPQYPLDAEMEENTVIFHKSMESVLTYLPFPIPFLKSSPHAARAGMISRIGPFLSMMSTQDPPTQILAEFIAWSEQHSLTNEQFAIIFSVLNWGIFSNFEHTAFWLLAHLLCDEGFLGVQESLRATVTKCGGLDKILSAHPDSLPSEDFELLDSAIQETLRLTTLSVSVRRAQRNTSVSTEQGEFAVKKDEWIMCDTHTMNKNAAVYTQDPDSFQIDRFVKRKGYSPPSFPLAFAAGANRCKGQDFVLHELRMLVISFVELYDASVVGPQKNIPTHHKQNAIAVHIPSQEFLVRLVPRVS